MRPSIRSEWKAQIMVMDGFEKHTPSSAHRTDMSEGLKEKYPAKAETETKTYGKILMSESQLQSLTSQAWNVA